MSITLVSGTTVVELRDPDFGNQLKVEITRINRKSRGGDQIIYKDLAWPITKTISYKFSYLSQTDVYNLMNFINLTLGQNILLIDFETRSWIGVIITPAAKITQPEREGFSAQFEFQGDLS